MNSIKQDWPPMVKTVSNTEVTAFNECELKHFYMYEQGIGPVQVEDSPYRGTVGHAALASYYEQLRDGNSRDNAMEAAWETYRQEMMVVVGQNDFHKLQILNGLKGMLEGYFNHYVTEPFKVLEVEKIFSAPMEGSVYYASILDLVVEWTVGPDRGNIMVVDHKFVYNFMNPEVLAVDAQQPKYIKVLQLNGYPVRKGYYNQIRTRSLKDPKATDLFKREPVHYREQTAIDTVWDEQRKVVRKIVMPDPEYPVRALAPMTCKNCSFRRLCKAEMNGTDTTTMRKIEFRTRERPLKNYDGE